MRLYLTVVLLAVLLLVEAGRSNKRGRGNSKDKSKGTGKVKPSKHSHSNEHNCDKSSKSSSSEEDPVSTTSPTQTPQSSGEHGCSRPASDFCQRLVNGDNKAVMLDAESCLVLSGQQNGFNQGNGVCRNLARGGNSGLRTAVARVDSLEKLHSAALLVQNDLAWVAAKSSGNAEDITSYKYTSGARETINPFGLSLMTIGNRNGCLLYSGSGWQSDDCQNKNYKYLCEFNVKNLDQVCRKICDNVCSGNGGRGFATFADDSYYPYQCNCNNNQLIDCVAGGICAPEAQTTTQQPETTTQEGTTTTEKAITTTKEVPTTEEITTAAPEAPTTEQEVPTTEEEVPTTEEQEVSTTEDETVTTDTEVPTTEIEVPTTGQEVSSTTACSSNCGQLEWVMAHESSFDANAYIVVLLGLYDDPSLCGCYLPDGGYSIGECPVLCE